MIVWSSDNIDFFKEASGYTGFHRELARIIKPYLKPEWTMADLGCGLGLLDIQLADSVKEITAVDSNEAAISDYNNNITENGISNIKAETGDANAMGDKKWDVLLLSFFGGFDDEMDKLFVHAGHRVIMVTFANSTSATNRMRSDLKKKSTTETKVKFLESRGYKFKKIMKTMEFGQPFRSPDDARRFFKMYSADDEPDMAKELINKNMNKLVKTDDKTFPYFFPKKKDIGILIIDK